MPLHPFANEGLEQTTTSSTTSEPIMPTLIQLAKSRTLQFSAALTVLSAAQSYIGLFNLTPTQQGYAGLVLGVVIAVLRWITSLPLSEK